MIKMSEEEIPTKKPVQLSDFEEADETTVPVIFRMSKTTYKKLGQIALDRETSRVALVREAITEYLKKLEQPQEQNPKIADRQLDRILKDCTKEDGGFEIDGEGFIAQFSAKGWKLSDLTEIQWEKVKEKLQIGYDGYTFKPEPSEFAEKFAGLEPSEEQLAWLSGETEEEATESET